MRGLRHRPIAEPRSRHDQLAAGREDDRAFDDVAQLADVSRPGVALQLAQALLRNRLDRLAERPGELVDEGPHQRGDVLDPLAQRRNDDGKHVEAIEEILAKRLVADRVLEVAVRGRDDADVDLDGLRAPEAFDDALLKHAQQLDLDLHRQFTDLVEKQRGLVGGFEPADLPRERARVRALLAAEQLALDERRRNRRAAHADHRPLTARAEVVNRLRHHFLARSRFAEQQDGGGRGRDLSDLRQHLPDGRALHPSSRQFSLGHRVRCGQQRADPVANHQSTPSAPATLSAEFNPSSWNP